MTITTYDTPMTCITELDYDTLLTHLGEQLAAVNALTTAWTGTKTPRGWLAAAGKAIDVDTSNCVGI